jgi:DNA repair exonuclease SbcCD ATPase subunit
MIEFKQIKYKNFLSSGNYFTTIPLNEHKDTLIVGNNGSGKSTLLDALTFSLFGKPFRRITKSQLINSVNERDAKVEIEFSISNVDYQVVRGIKPNVFEIYKNGQKLNEDSSANDQQKYLEGQVLKLNYKSFTQIVILGSASFVPFMQLSAPHRREVIEDLLDIKVFSSMSDILKDKLKVCRDRIKVLELKKESIADKIVMQKRFIKQIEEEGENDINKKRQKIADCEEKFTDYQERVEELITGVSEKEKAMAEYIGSGDTVKKLERFRDKVNFKRQDASGELDKIGKLKEDIDKYRSNVLELEEAVNAEEQRYAKFLGFQNEITKLNNEISQHNIHLSTTTKYKKDLEKEIQSITDKLENRTVENDKLEEYKTRLKDILSELTELKDDYEYLDQSKLLMNDDGVKKSIIRKYLPLINRQVNDYLQRMDFYINFTLDEEFSESIQTPMHERFSYASFSEGEKMRIDLALLFTWRDIARMKNSVVTNLLIMDEVFDSSLDGFGTDEFLKIVRFVLQDANVFIISHKNELYDKFHYSMEFVKEKGFSKLKP